MCAGESGASYSLYSEYFSVWYKYKPLCIKYNLEARKIELVTAKDWFHNPNITGIWILAKVGVLLKFGLFPPAPGKLCRRTHTQLA